VEKLDLDKPAKTGKEIIKGTTDAIKDLPAKAKGWKEPTKIAITGLAGIPLEIALETLSNMVFNAFGGTNSPYLDLAIKMGIKIGVPIGIGSIFIIGKLPFSKLVAVASITTIAIAIGREVLSRVGVLRQDGSGKKEIDAQELELTPHGKNWDKMVG